MRSSCDRLDLCPLLHHIKHFISTALFSPLPLHYCILPSFAFIFLLKVLHNEKRGGLRVVSFDIGLALSYSRCDFQTTNRCKPRPVRGLKLFGQPCFCCLQTIIVSQRRTKNCWRYLNFADLLEPGGGGGGGQHSLVECCMMYHYFFLKVGGFLKLHHRRITESTFPVRINTSRTNMFKVK